MSDSEDQPPARRGDARSAWLSPAGISAMAGVVGLLLIVIGWFVAGELRGDAAPTPEQPEPSSAENLIFVYGSAMPDHWAYSTIARYVESSRRDEVEGLLFDSGRGYPMAKFEVGGSIPGFLLELDEATLEDAVRALTQLEGGMFAPVEVRTQSGATALAYEYIDSTEGYPRIDAWIESFVGDFGVRYALIDFLEGECFDSSATPGVGVLVKCTTPHHFSAFHVRDLTVDNLGESFPGQPTLVEIADARCNEAFAELFAREPNVDEVSWHVPTESQWDEGFRSAVCAARGNA